MDYFLKSSAVLVIFYICYRLFLQRETFFTGNRWFLFLGIITSIILPLFPRIVYVEYEPVMFLNMASTSTITEPNSVTTASFDYMQLISIVYLIGLLFFIMKMIFELVSLFITLQKYPSIKNSYTYIKTDKEVAPFSFFNWIVYNPSMFSENELKLILKHEKVHVNQWHSLDVILSQLVCALLWFNPIVWFYKKSMLQNLEFIADNEAQHIAPCEKSYQHLLLKTSIPSHQLAMTNNFYNSLIKKRIVMLHKSKSNRINALKYALVFPLLTLFVFNFNTKTIAQTPKKETEKVLIGQNIIKYVVTKTTKDNQLESIQEKMAEKDVKIDFRKVTRNSSKEIIGIKIAYDYNKKSGEFYVNSDEPIKDIAITLNVNENELSVAQAMKNLSQSFEIITEDGEKKVKTSRTGSNSNVFVYSTDDEDEVEVKKDVIVVGKDGEEHEVKTEKKVYIIKSGSTKNSSDSEDEVVFIKKNKKDTVWIKKDVKNIVWTNDDGEDVEIITVENDNKNFKVFTSGDDQPLIFLDGKEISKKDMEAIDPKNIESVNVLKGDKAIEKHGKKAKDGVIEITSKKN